MYLKTPGCRRLCDNLIGQGRARRKYGSRMRLVDNTLCAMGRGGDRSVVLDLYGSYRHTSWTSAFIHMDCPIKTPSLLPMSRTLLLQHFYKPRQAHLPECRDDLRRVEPRAVLGKDALTAQMEEQLTTVHVLHHKAQPIDGLERIFQ